jgi:chemotaxis response regulator CheB
MAKKKTTVSAPETPVSGFPIVGIGASAGGLAAFEAFFSGMPADIDPGMAFVLVQHLAPDHKSILSDLIRRCTRMQVFEVEDGMPRSAIATGLVDYVLPPSGMPDQLIAYVAHAFGKKPWPWCGSLAVPRFWSRTARSG